MHNRILFNLKKEVIPDYTIREMSFEYIMLSEISQSREDKNLDLE